MSDTTFSNSVNREAIGLPTIDPASHEEFLAAAIDGRDYRTIALLVLDHPLSKFLTPRILEELGNVAFADDCEFDAPVRRRVLAAGNVFLSGGRL